MSDFSITKIPVTVRVIKHVGRNEREVEMGRTEYPPMSIDDARALSGLGDDLWHGKATDSVDFGFDWGLQRMIITLTLEDES